MKEKIIKYIETLEVQAKQSDKYFKERNELYISNQQKDKEIERLNNIIQELEKYLEQARIDVNKVNKDGGAGLQMALTKLQELKERK